MNKELGRKITSLTLMTIMLTWTTAMGFSGSFMPEAEAANQYLWVSAEDAGGNNFYGGQVLEIVVTDPAINRLDEAYGMPDVTIDGKKVIMAQGVDGSWYAYIADGSTATSIDSNYPEVEDGKGADYGRWCQADTNLEFGPNDKSVAALIPSESRGVALPHQLGNTTVPTTSSSGTHTYIGAATFTYTQGTGVTTDCDSADVGGNPLVYLNASAQLAHTGALATGVNASDQAINNVVREARSLSNGTTTDFYGNIALGPNLWPFIQLYDFTRYQTYDLVYERGGADETIPLSYDRPGATNGGGLSFDKDHYGLTHEVGVTLGNNEFNIDPTDEDSWTFGTLPTNATVFYQLFDENGNNDSSTTAGAIDFSQGTQPFGFDTGVLEIDRNGPGDATNNVLMLQDNGDQRLSSDTEPATSEINAASQPVTFTETGANTGIFTNWDDSLKTNLYINAAADRGTQATFSWDDVEFSVLYMPFWGTIAFNTDGSDGATTGGAIGAEWNSGELVEIVLDDNDMNLDARSQEQMTTGSNTTIVPAVKIGSPITLATLDTLTYLDETATNSITFDADINDTQCSSDYGAAGTAASYVSCYEKYSERAVVTSSVSSDITVADNDQLRFVFNGSTVGDLKDMISNANGTAAYSYIQYDFRSINGGGNDSNYYLNFTIGDDSIDSCTANSATAYTNAHCSEARFADGLIGRALINSPGDKLKGLGSTATNALTDSQALRVTVQLNSLDGSALGDTLSAGTSYPLTMDVVTFGQSNDGVASSDRHNNSIYRLEVDEVDANGGIFVGELDFIMLNQLNVNQTSTYNDTKTDHEENRIIVHNDLTDEDEIRINYLDMGADGVETQVADQLAAPTHSGVVEFDNDSYKEADTVVVTLTDADLNTNPDIIDIYSVVNTGGDTAEDMIGKSAYGSNSVGDANGRMLDITFDDELWLESASTNNSTTCTSDTPSVDGLAETGFTLVETGRDTGVFTGDFQVPDKYCARSSGTGTVSATMGTDIEVNYVDYRDASGEIIEVGDGAGIRGNTGSVSLDRTVYPVPFGTIGDFSTESSKSTPNGRALFPLHSGAITSALDATTETVGAGDLTIHIRVDDPDYDVSATGEDQIAENTTTSSNRGPLKIYVARGSDSVVLATAGGDTAQDGVITIGSSVVDGGTANGTRELGSISETAPDSGVFELDMTVRYTDGPASTDCSSKTNSYTATNGGSTSTETDRFATAASSGNYCILQGDVITVEYTDQNDASGNSAVAYDSATFDLRNGVIQTDKSVYIIGSDIIMTLIEPDLDLESDESETWDLDLIEWDSDAATLTMGNAGGSASSFDPEPSDFRETGDSTGIFQIVIETPATLGGSSLDRGELIDLEYTDWAPAGANYVGEEYTDIGLSIYTSNFGATIEMDQKVYTWTDKIYVTIVAPDHNFDSGLVDKIGDTDDDPLIVQTRSQKLTSYTLAETGTDTGIFSGEVILKGFSHDADGDPATGSSGYDVTGVSSASGSGPTDGVIKAEDDDGITISYEFNEDEVVVGSALIRWNVGEVQWLESSYPAGGNGVVRVVDPDMNWDPENVDNFEVDVWSDSDAGGISLMITETNEATGIFEGTVSFTADDESSGHRLRVAEGDTITAEYEDNTLPDPYTRSDDLDITGTAIIGTIVPPLERAPAANARVVDSFGNSLSEVSVDQQVQIEADLVNGQDRDQSFAYLVQVQDGNGVTVSLAWITGQLAAGQSFSPALSWIPTASGSYEATVFVWESVDNPTALSDTVSVSIRVV
ncbi:hypothetical protein OAI67_02850 [Candidatus Nitrosopelagicus sp.]|nr:hypothetical protein [Candidatus Nitrosopelagicus sp.]